jgi:hypothetical protein
VSARYHLQNRTKHCPSTPHRIKDVTHAAQRLSAAQNVEIQPRQLHAHLAVRARARVCVCIQGMCVRATHVWLTRRLTIAPPTPRIVRCSHGLPSCSYLIVTNTSVTQAVLLDNNSIAVWPGMSVFVGNQNTNPYNVGPTFISMQNNLLTSLPSNAFSGWRGELLAMYLQNNNITRIAPRAMVDSPTFMYVVRSPNIRYLCINSSACCLTLFS